MFDEVAKELHETAVEKGFWGVAYKNQVWQEGRESLDIFMTKQLMMIVSEAVEVMEAIRKSKGPEEVADEMADIIIRTLDLYAGLREFEYVNGSLDEAFEKKTGFNKLRPERHGVRF
jgi:NTP pyrophosphatase (non-canonical NTP hydrolase)